MDDLILARHRGHGEAGGNGRDQAAAALAYGALGIAGDGSHTSDGPGRLAATMHT